MIRARALALQSWQDRSRRSWQRGKQQENGRNVQRHLNLLTSAALGLSWGGPSATLLVERRYRDSDGDWKSSGSFSRNEIPLAVYCMQKSFEHVIETQKEEGNRDGGAKEEEVMY